MEMKRHFQWLYLVFTTRGNRGEKNNYKKQNKKHEFSIMCWECTDEWALVLTESNKQQRISMNIVGGGTQRDFIHISFPFSAIVSVAADPCAVWISKTESCWETKINQALANKTFIERWHQSSRFVSSRTPLGVCGKKRPEVMMEYL